MYENLEINKKKIENLQNQQVQFITKKLLISAILIFEQTRPTFLILELSMGQLGKIVLSFDAMELLHCSNFDLQYRK